MGTLDSSPLEMGDVADRQEICFSPTCITVQYSCQNVRGMFIKEENVA